jgi:hypothetical protein
MLIRTKTLNGFIDAEELQWLNYSNQGCVYFDL